MTIEMVRTDELQLYEYTGMLRSAVAGEPSACDPPYCAMLSET